MHEKGESDGDGDQWHHGPGQSQWLDGQTVPSDRNTKYELQKVACSCSVLVLLFKAELRMVVVYRPLTSSPEADRGVLELISRAANDRHKLMILHEC